MTDDVGPLEYEDINEKVIEEWVDETTPYQRIREVISHVYRPTSASDVADRAAVTAKTARKHLERLADEGYVETEHGKRGATLYKRSEKSLILEQATNILSEVSVSDLTSNVQEMRAEIEGFREEFDAESPEEVVADDSVTIDSEVLQRWQTLRRNLAFAKTALTLAEAERTVIDVVPGSSEEAIQDA